MEFFPFHRRYSAQEKSQDYFIKYRFTVQIKNQDKDLVTQPGIRKQTLGHILSLSTSLLAQFIPSTSTFQPQFI